VLKTQLIGNEKTTNIQEKEMKHNLSFVSIVQPCNPANGEAKLVKKDAIEGLAPSSTSRGQAKPQHHPF
jgi:hypothetical protein